MKIAPAPPLGALPGDAAFAVAPGKLPTPPSSGASGGCPSVFVCCLPWSSTGHPSHGSLGKEVSTSECETGGMLPEIN